VEGHGSLVIDIKNRKVKDLRLNIFEGSRFFEPLLKGRGYDEVPEISSRICGICVIAHHLTAVKAVEKALGVTPSEQTIELRKLLDLAGLVQSHVLHLYFLALSDYLGYESTLAMIGEHPEVVKRALRMKKLANDASELIAGSPMRQATPVIGGFTSLPTKHQLEHLLRRMKDAKTDAIKTLDLFASLKVPEFERKVECFALAKEKTFAIYDGEQIASTEGLYFPVEEYQQHIKEFVVPYSTAKHSISVSTGESFLVGALARINVNKQHLSDGAKEAMDRIEVRFPNYNPYMNNLAQALEIVHSIDQIVCTLEKLLDVGVKDEKPEVKVRAGEGVAATEAPRGTLYHHYKINNAGRVEYANIITPTAQNLKNMEEDLKAVVPQLLDLPKDEIVLNLEKLIRAYDPCISCSTHFLETKFV